MEGTISLGIYDDGGKLVRILHREAEVGEFVAALNGLITHWDGNDDKGIACPPGKYHARGFKVGELDIQGVDFQANDWITDDDSPRISRITGLAVAPSGLLFIKTQTVGRVQALQPAVFSVAMKAAEADDEPEPQLTPATEADFPVLTGTNGTSATSGTSGTGATGGNTWTIDGTTLKELSPTGQVLHTLAAKPDGPVPVKLAASPSAAGPVYVLEENSAVQRLRALDFTGTPPTGEPRVIFTKEIRFSDRFEQVASTLVFPDGKPFTSVPVLAVTLVPNPLMQDKPGAVQIAAAFDKTGSLLATADGLPLDHVSETTRLKWAVMGREEGSKIVTVFESDGAVVSEFTIARLANMMAFDAGDLEIAPAPAEPAPAASASPTPALSPEQ